MLTPEREAELRAWADARPFFKPGKQVARDLFDEIDALRNAYAGRGATLRLRLKWGRKLRQERDEARAEIDALRAEIERLSEVDRLLALALAKHDERVAEIERLREYWEASQAVQSGIIDFDLHGAAVDRLEAATKAVRLHDLTRPIPAALNEKEPDADA